MIANGLLAAINIAQPGAKRARLRIPASELQRMADRGEIKQLSAGLYGPLDDQ